MRQLLWDSEPRNDVFAPIRPIGVTHVGATAGAVGNDKRLDAGDPARSPQPAPPGTEMRWPLTSAMLMVVTSRQFWLYP
jgi:hypothetical protein